MPQKGKILLQLPILTDRDLSSSHLPVFKGHLRHYLFLSLELTEQDENVLSRKQTWNRVGPASVTKNPPQPTNQLKGSRTMQRRLQKLGCGFLYIFP